VSPLKIENDALADEQVLFLLRHFPDWIHGGGKCRNRAGRHGCDLGLRPGRAIRDPKRVDVGRWAGDCDRSDAGAAQNGGGKRQSRGHQFRKRRRRRLRSVPGDDQRCRGPDRCIDAVGAEAHGAGAFDAVLDKAKASIYLATDRPHVLREAIMCCRKGGTLSVPGVYIGFADKLPMGALMNKGLTIKSGQTHMKRYTQPLLDKINAGEIDPSFVITHNRPLEEGPELYQTFRDKKDGCIKVVLKP
jgi:threonine dehydrogenase-like Zn-dependent dehydrogenase